MLLRTPVLSLPEIVAGIQSSDSDSQFAATQSCGRMLSHKGKSAIEDVIQAGVLPHLVEFLSCSDRSDIWYEAAWALTNVASGISQQTRAVKAAAVAPFIHLLSSKLLIVNHH